MMLSFIVRNGNDDTKDTILILYNALVRPYLEYAIQLCYQTWSKIKRNLSKLNKSNQINPFAQTS